MAASAARRVGLAHARAARARGRVGSAAGAVAAGRVRETIALAAMAVGSMCHSHRRVSRKAEGRISGRHSAVVAAEGERVGGRGGGEANRLQRRGADSESRRDEKRKQGMNAEHDGGNVDGTKGGQNLWWRLDTF